MEKRMYEYRMTPHGNLVTIPKGSCPPMNSLFIGEGEVCSPPSLTEEQTYDVLVCSINYDKSLHF